MAMTLNKSGFFWGMLLIGAGVLALMQQMGTMNRFPEQVWTWTFVLTSLLGVVSYGLSGWRQWGWLFPAGIFGGLAATVALTSVIPNSPALATPLFVGMLIPFAGAYLTDRAKNWWALIPGGVMLFVALTTLLVDSVGGEWVGTLFLFMIAFSFLMAYLSRPARRWALLVAYIAAVLSIAPAMASGETTAPYYGSVFLLGIALPFFYVYFRSMEKWWALIPASAMTALAIVAVPAIAGWIRGESGDEYAMAFIMAGLAAAFAVIWLRHAKAWAKVVTIALAALTVASVLLAARSAILWPVAIILVGAYLLFVSMRGQKT
jgi:hypothetical protein